MEAKEFLEDKQTEHFNKFGVYADTNSKIAEWIEEYTKQYKIKDSIIEYQTKLIELYETEREGTEKFNYLSKLFKSIIADLKK